MRRAWVITGLGLVTAAGSTARELHEALCRGTLPARAHPSGDSGAGSAPTLSLPIEGFDPKAYIQRRGLKDLSRTSQLACAAAAPIAASLDGIPSGDVGVVLGTGWGGLRSVVDFEWETCSVPARFINPLLFAETVSNVPAGQISIIFGWWAFNLTVSGGSASGLQAIRESIDLLEEGRAAIAVAGGADEINLPALRVRRAEGTSATTIDSLPLGRGRSGLIGGEGSCLLALESLTHARARGAEPLGRVRAAEARFIDTGGAPGPSSADIVTFLGGMIERAEVSPEAIDLVAISANGCPHGDREEAEAMRELFGDGEDRPMVIAPKGVIGETWGTSGPLALVAVLESMRTGTVPPRPAGFVPDPDLPVLAMAPEPSSRQVRNALVLARTETGHLAGVVLEAGGGEGEA